MKNPEIHQILLREYPLPATNITIQKIDTGVENTNYLINLNDEPKYVFRIYNSTHSIRGTRTQSQIGIEHAFIETAYKTGLPTPLPQKNLNDQTFIQIQNSDTVNYAALFNFIKGSSPTKFTKDITKEFANAVNNLLLAGGKFSHVDDKSIEVNIIDRMSNIYAKLEHNNMIQDLYKLFLERFNKLNIAELNKGIVHGDLKLENVLFIDNKLSAVLDYDDFRYSCLLEEIVMTMMHNLHSKSENLIRAGFSTDFLNRINCEEINTDILNLKTLLLARLIYDLSKTIMKGKFKLAESLVHDPEINKHILS